MYASESAPNLFILLTASFLAATQKHNADGTQKIIESIDWKAKMNAIARIARPNVIGWRMMPYIPVITMKGGDTGFVPISPPFSLPGLKRILCLC